MKIFIIVLLLIFLPTQLFAGVGGKVYFSGAVGHGIFTDYTDGEIEVDFDNDFNWNGAFGYDMGAVRIEGEVAYRNLDTGDILIGGVPLESIRVPAILLPDNNQRFFSEGDLGALTFMFNGYYDIEIQGSNWSPYIGFGLGAARIEKKLVTGFVSTQIVTPDDPATPDVDELETVEVKTDVRDEASETSTEFAYQTMVGLGYNIYNDLTLSGEYRFLGWSNNNGVYAHEFNIGLRFAF